MVIFEPQVTLNDFWWPLNKGPLWPPTSFNDLEWPWMTFDPRIEILFFTIFGEELMTSNDPQWPMTLFLGIISRVQAKSFTKALNALLKEEDEIKNLFSDLKDGKKLIKVVRHFTGADLVSLTSFDPHMTPFDPMWLHLAKSVVILPRLTPFDLYGLIWLHLTYWPYMASFDLIWPYLTS